MTQQVFGGSWLVTESVYDPDGGLAGVNYQRRRLETLPGGRIRVTQTCDPSPELDDHPLGRFRGAWVFDMSIDGQARRYHGPDVVGVGLTWGAGVMTGRGLWPRLGVTFTSYAMLASPERQITGGVFSVAGRTVAEIVGVAMVERDGHSFPPPLEAMEPHTLSARWHGTRRTALADGVVIAESEMARVYDDGGRGWQDSVAGQRSAVSLASGPMTGALQMKSDTDHQGLARRVGPMLRSELVDDAGVLVEVLEILDAAGGRLLALHRTLRDHVVQQVDFLHLQPE